MSYSQKLPKGSMQGRCIGFIKGGTRSRDYSSHEVKRLRASGF